MRLNKIFGNNVKYFRYRKKFTQEKVAELTNMSVTYISQLELGHHTPSFERLENLSKALGVEPFEFYVKIDIGDISMIQYKKIIDLREDNDYTQEYISRILKVSRSTYANWETGDNKIPLEILDKLSVLYNVPFSYLLDIKNRFEINKKIYPIDYKYFYNNLINLKKQNKHTYQDIADFLNVTKSTVYKYYVGKLDITIDILILLSKLNNIDIDKLCGKLK